MLWFGFSSVFGLFSVRGIYLIPVWLVLWYFCSDLSERMDGVLLSWFDYCIDFVQ